MANTLLYFCAVIRLRITDSNDLDALLLNVVYNLVYLFIAKLYKSIGYTR